MADTCVCGHEDWWHWGNTGPCHEEPCECRNFTARPAAGEEKP